ncbi:hypothetical protein HDU76_006602 [Blyttiomyces sp. JEL0837]|nr:hypothetical protein HDU76_006602 [Blyttiomyces sp. JEL0837]
MDSDLELPNQGNVTNSTLDEVVEAIIQERHYNILLWTPFIAIPLCIVGARALKYVYRLWQAKKYGYGDDLFEDPLAQLGLAQLGITIYRDYDNLSDIRKIRKEQKKLEKKLSRAEKINAAKTHTRSSSFSERAQTFTERLFQKNPEEVVGVSAFIARPMFLAENYLKTLRIKTRKTWKDYFSPEAIRNWLNTSKYGRMWMIFQVICTIIAIGNYVFLTYAIQREERSQIEILDLCLALIFLMDYSISMYIAEDRLAFYFNWASMVDLVSIVPPIVYVLVSKTSQYVWFLGLLRILRASRILRTYRLLSFSETEERRELTIAALSFCNFIFLSASVINALETLNVNYKKDPSLVYWHDSLYYIMVTFSTIGFGDLTPSSVPSRVVVMLLIVMVIIYVPIQTTRISEIYNSSSSFQRARYSASRKHSHVVLSGVVTYTAIIDFCREFFTCDPDANVVILCPSEPSIETRRLLRHPYYRQRLHYLSGTALSIPDLKRASTAYATAMFLLNTQTAKPNQSSMNEDEQIRVTRGADAEILLQSLVAKKAFRGLPIFAQVQDIRSEDLSEHCGCDRVLGIDNIKMSILARECQVPGYLTFLLNLVSTYRLNATPYNAEESDEFWKQEYVLGASNQIYAFKVPPGLARTKWSEVVESAFRCFNVLIVAVQSSTGPNAQKLVLNPDGDYHTRDDDILFSIAQGNDEVILRLSIQFKDPIPRAELEILELEAEMNSKLPPIPASVAGSLDALGGVVSIAKSATVDNPFDSEEEKLRNHIILCGHMTARGVKHFVKSMREADGRQRIDGEENDNDIPIICMLETLPDDVSEVKESDTRLDGVWSDVARDKKFTFLRGTPLKKSSLLQAGIQRCRRIVIFSSPVETTTNGGESSDILPDSNSIFIVKMIQEEWPHINYIVELVSGGNVKYLTQNKREIEFDTTNLQMQSILNNYALNTSDRLSLYKRIRQKGAEEETFARRLFNFIFGGGSIADASGGGQSSKRTKNTTGKPSEKSWASLLLRQGKDQSNEDDERVGLRSNAKATGGQEPEDEDQADTDNPFVITSSSATTEEKQDTKHLNREKVNDSLLTPPTEMEEDINDDSKGLDEQIDEPELGKASAPVSSSFLQKLVDEAELQESGLSPFPVYYFDRNFAMGRIKPISFMHTLLSQTYFRPYLVDIIKALSASVFHIPVPDKFHNRKYAELVAYCLKKGRLPLGLYRGALKWTHHVDLGKIESDRKKLGQFVPQESKMPYIYTNPRGFDLVDKEDLLLVL